MAKIEVKGITASQEDFGEWFSQLMLKADLADYTEVSGCMVFKPRSYALWEKVRDLCDERFKKLGIQNTYFPLFIPEKFLTQEADHVEGFAPEVAWVEKAGNNVLAERLAVRPTSEAIMYPSYSKWIRSWRDLPLRYNQWNNVVRWEFKHPVPFMRTREFLWNELHTVLATEKEALDEIDALKVVYRDVVENYMALYVVDGRKTENEKFAGAVSTDKFHHFLPNGRVIEGCCFHHDGQNFAKAYNISFLDKDEKKQFAYQNTYAITTRMLGAMFAMHSDEKGLIIPPKMATEKVVVLPIFVKGKEAIVLKEAKKLVANLEGLGVILDDREDKRPGEKFAEWELKGVPVRIEIGPRDVEAGEVVIVRRDNGEKISVKEKDVKKKLEKVFDEIQKNLFERSKKMWEDSVVRASSMKELKEAIKDKKIAIVALAEGAENEDVLKAETGGAKTLFIAEEKLKKGEKCVVSGKKADYLVYVGKTY